MINPNMNFIGALQKSRFWRVKATHAKPGPKPQTINPKPEALELERSGPWAFGFWGSSVWSLRAPGAGRFKTSKSGV